MRLSTLTALFCFIALAACNKDLTERETTIVKTLPVTSKQNIPELPTAGSGEVSIDYTPVNKAVNYKITWSNLTDSVIAIRINGPSPAGYNSVNPAFTGASPTSPSTTPHVVVQEFVGTAIKSLYAKSGSFSNTLLIDGVKVKEDLLNEGYYYFTIHTKTTIPAPATPPTSLFYRWIGEIRGQLIVK
jgi:hypothetical protein